MTWFYLITPRFLSILVFLLALRLLVVLHDASRRRSKGLAALSLVLGGLLILALAYGVWFVLLLGLNS